MTNTRSVCFVHEEHDCSPGLPMGLFPMWTRKNNYQPTETVREVD